MQDIVRIAIREQAGIRFILHGRSRIQHVVGIESRHNQDTITVIKVQPAALTLKIFLGLIGNALSSYNATPDSPKEISSSREICCIFNLPLKTLH